MTSRSGKGARGVLRKFILENYLFKFLRQKDLIPSFPPYHHGWYGDSKKYKVEKLTRYVNLFKKVNNWKGYLFRKMIGFGGSFEFDIKNLGKIKVAENMLGPFKENLLDEIYFLHIPKSILASTSQPAIVDIGANVGFFSLAAFSKYPKARIYAFEPHPYCFKVLSEYQKKFSSYKWMVFNNAVSDADEELILNTETINGFTTMASIYTNENKGEVFTVGAVSFDSFICRNMIEHIDFMKIDCEGAEYSILYSMPKELFGKIKSMCIETHRGTEQNQTIDFLNNFIQGVGFETKISDRGFNGYIWAWRN